MNTIDTPTATVSFLNEHIVVVKAKAGVEINREVATRGNQLIADSMPGDYGQIIDRQEDYSLTPVEVFQCLNEIPRLKAMAVVVHRKNSVKTAAIGSHLFHGEFAVFTDIGQAQDWIENILRPQSPG